MRAARELHLKLSAEQQKLLEEWLLEFERDWSPSSLPNWQKRLQSQPPELVEAAMLELVKIDLECNWQAGRRESLAAYLDKYPSLGDRATVPPELIQAEIEVRKQFGAPAGREFLTAEYPGREDDWLPILDAGATVKRAAETSRIGDETLIKTVEHSVPSPSHQADAEVPKMFGRYRLLKVLGRGGMGSVYLAEDTILHRKCAIKLPHFEKKRDREILERFLREAQAAASVRHENICTIYDVGDIGGEYFISMEFIEGRPLTDFISPSKPGRQRATVHTVLKLALALKHAHEKQIVHRDLKPANIMIKAKSQPVIMDFGLACSLEVSDKSRATTEGTILGTPAYMSPEQVLGRIKEIGPRSDIYSLGVILYEMLTGQIPFRGSVQAILGQIIGQQPAPLRELRHDIDHDLEAICLKMMAKGPADRYQSMGEVADALTEWLRRVNAGVDGSETMMGTAPVAPPAAPATQHVDADSQPTLVRPASPFPTLKQRVREEVDPKAQTMLTPPTLKRDRKRRKSDATGWWVVGGLLGGIGLLWGIIILLSDENGTLRIEVNDEHLEVAINGDEVHFTNRRGEMELDDGSHDLKILVEGTEVPIGEEFTLTTREHDGQYRVVVQFGETELSNERFTFERDGETALKVELLQVEVPSNTTNDESSGIATTESPRGANEDSGSERAQIITQSEPELLMELPDSKDMEQVEVTSDGARAVGITLFGDIKVWDLSTGIHTLIGTMETGDPVDDLDLSPDGRFAVFSLRFTGFCVWDIIARAQIGRNVGLSGDTSSVEFSADGRSLFVGGQSMVRCYRQSLGANSWTAEDFTNPIADTPGTGIVVADPKNSSRAYFNAPTGSREHRVVVLWDFEDDSEIQRYTAFHDYAPDRDDLVFVRSVSSDGSRLVIGGDTFDSLPGIDRLFQMIDSRSGALLSTIILHGTGLSPNIYCSNDCETALIRNWENPASGFESILYWDLVRNEKISGWQRSFFASSFDVAFLPTPDLAVIDTGQSLQLWRLPLPDSRSAAVPGNTTDVADASPESRVESIDAPPLAVAPFDADQAAEHQQAWAEHLGVPVEYTNSIGMEFVLVPPGTFLMGSPDSEEGRDVDEGPRHEVTITQPFYLGICEVTQANYEDVTGINPSAFSPSGGSSDFVQGVDTSRFPVEGVSWQDANDFCTRLAERPDEVAAGCVYRLPTEAEWEYACRAGTTSPYSDARPAPRVLMTRPYLNIPGETGQGMANPWGLFDMHGRIWEWCADWYAETYPPGPATDPRGPAEGDQKVYRGGWHDDGEYEVGSAERSAMPPSYALDDNGFRVMLEITPEFIAGWRANPE